MLSPIRFVPESFVPFWKPDLTNEEYHSDKTALSSSQLRDIKKSPYNFYYYHVLGNRREETDQMRFGTAVHSAILEPRLFLDSVIVEPEFKGKGSVAAYAMWLESIPKEKLILNEKTFKAVSKIHETVYAHSLASHILWASEVEQSGYFRDPNTGILCKFRPDFFNEESCVLGDVKTTKDCTREAFSRKILSLGYHIQMYFYCLGFSQMYGKPVKRPLFLVIETSEPYEVVIYEANEQMMEQGQKDYEFLMAKLKYCLETNEWPRYQPEGITKIELPPWAFYEQE